MTERKQPDVLSAEINAGARSRTSILSLGGRKKWTTRSRRKGVRSIYAEAGRRGGVCSCGEGMKKRVMRPSLARLQLQTPVMI